MKAAQFFGRGDIRVVEVDEPHPNPDQVLVSVEWAGICGTDLHEYVAGPFVIPTPERPHRGTNAHLPVTLGHEFCGRIKHAPASSNLKTGTLVMVDPRTYCGTCHRCSTSATQACLTWGFVGLTGGGGGFSQTVAIDPSHCYPLPNSVPPEDVALIEPLAVAWHAVKSSRITGWTDKTVLITGGGPIGCAVIHVLRAQGSANIVLSEPTALRRDQTGALADIVINPAEENLPLKCRDLTRGIGIDVVFDCAGVQRAADTALDALCHRGVYVNVAGWETPFVLPLQFAMLKEIHIEFSMAYNEQDFAEVVDAFIAGKFPRAHEMVTSRISLDDVVSKGFDELVHHKDKHIKILVTPKQ